MPDEMRVPAERTYDRNDRLDPGIGARLRPDGRRLLRLLDVLDEGACPPPDRAGHRRHAVHQSSGAAWNHVRGAAALFAAAAFILALR